MPGGGISGVPAGCAIVARDVDVVIDDVTWFMFNHCRTGHGGDWRRGWVKQRKRLQSQSARNSLERCSSTHPVNRSSTHLACRQFAETDRPLLVSFPIFSFLMLRLHVKLVELWRRSQISRPLTSPSPGPPVHRVRPLRQVLAEQRQPGSRPPAHTPGHGI